MYVIKFRKRKLPLVHMLMNLKNDSKKQTTETIDEIISAEIPDLSEHPELNKIVMKNMIHGP